MQAMWLTITVADLDTFIKTSGLNHAMWLMIAVLCVLTIAYRFYGKFIAAKVLVLDTAQQTPAYALNDGHNYHPTNKWVLFGHHFAAISGAGPLIGPVLAAQFGYLPGLLWILIGVVLGGAVQDFVILVFSIRREGKSLAQIAYQEIGKTAGWAATVGILFVLVIALAGLGKVVVEALSGKTVIYPKGTALIAGPTKIRVVEAQSGIPSVFVPAGTTLQYPSVAAQEGTRMTVGDSFNISVPQVPEFVRADNLLEVEKLTLVESASRHIRGSTWGTFTIALTIPIALLTGLYMYRVRKGRVLEASLLGGSLTLVAVYLGAFIDQPGSWLYPLQHYFDLSGRGIANAMAGYGFIASVLPVWVLLCPRDYLSSFLKIGTVALLVLGVILANPELHAPAINHVFLNGGPILGQGHGIFPFVFITIMCGAVSGFHALVSSGTTPKMIKSEGDARMIGYGAMLIEGLVGIVALIAAASLPNAHYYHMNTTWQDYPQYREAIAQIAGDERPEHDLPTIERQVGETLQGRTGGAVTLAVGMSEIFDKAAKNILGAASQSVERLEKLIPYWYHFAIMFEALFILTTIDTGTRVGRFLLQEIFGKIHPKWGRPSYWPSAVLSTGLLVLGWWYFLDSNSMAAIWPMFGISNQLLAVMALAIASVCIVRSGKGRYVWVTLVPMGFVTLTTLTTAVIMLGERYRIMTHQVKAVPGGVLNAWIATGVILGIVICALVVMGGSIRAMAWRKVEVGGGCEPVTPPEDAEDVVG